MYQFIEYYNNIILLSRIMKLVLVITYLQFIYKFTNLTKSVWECNQYFQNKCHGRVHLSDGNILNRAIQA